MHSKLKDLVFKYIFKSQSCSLIKSEFETYPELFHTGGAVTLFFMKEVPKKISLAFKHVVIYRLRRTSQVFCPDSQ